MLFGEVLLSWKGSQRSNKNNNYLIVLIIRQPGALRMCDPVFEVVPPDNYAKGSAGPRQRATAKGKPRKPNEELYSDSVAEGCQPQTVKWLIA